MCRVILIVAAFASRNFSSYQERQTLERTIERRQNLKKGRNGNEKPIQLLPSTLDEKHKRGYSLLRVPTFGFNQFYQSKQSSVLSSCE